MDFTQLHDLRNKIDFITQALKENFDKMSNLQKRLDRVITKQKVFKHLNYPGFHIRIARLNDEGFKHLRVKNRLLEENQQKLSLQKQLIIDYNRLRSYMSDVDLSLKLISEGHIQFDKEHPLFNDIEFSEKLLISFEEEQQYEKCNEIQRHIESLKIQKGLIQDLSLN